MFLYKWVRMIITYLQKLKMNLFILLWIIATLYLCDVKAQGFGPGPLDMYKQYFRKFRSVFFNLLGRNSENPANLHKAKQLNVSTFQKIRE